MTLGHPPFQETPTYKWDRRAIATYDSWGWPSSVNRWRIFNLKNEQKLKKKKRDLAYKDVSFSHDSMKHNIDSNSQKRITKKPQKKKSKIQTWHGTFLWWISFRGLFWCEKNSRWNTRGIFADHQWIAREVCPKHSALKHGHFLLETLYVYRHITCIYIYLYHIDTLY